jgi:hypothetical protein
MSTTAEVSAFAIATRARQAATQAGVAAWALQVRAWPQPSFPACDGVLIALHQAAIHLRAAADVLDQPGLSTYARSIHVRSAVVSTAAWLVGVIVVGFALSGLTVAVVAAAYVPLVMGLRLAYQRWALTRCPREIEDAESSLEATATELTTEVIALLDVLQPDRCPHRAKAQASLKAAADWIQLATRGTGQLPSTSEP